MPQRLLAETLQRRTPLCPGPPRNLLRQMCKFGFVMRAGTHNEARVLPGSAASDILAFSTLSIFAYDEDKKVPLQIIDFSMSLYIRIMRITGQSMIMMV